MLGEGCFDLFFLVLGMLLISNASSIGDAIMGKRHDNHSNAFAIIFAVSEFIPVSSALQLFP
jgi:hypothetical protein